jgi:hypothetical protein
MRRRPGPALLLGLGLLLPASLQPLHGQDALVAALTTPGEWNHAERQRATHRLGRNLGTEDLGRLLAFLRHTPEEAGMRPDELRALKNNIADALVGQRLVDETLLDQFLGLARDPGQDIVWREYILQKLPDLALRLPAPEARVRTTDFLRGQSENTDYIMAGTAIIALERLGRDDPSLIGPVEIARRAQGILHNPDQANACKIAALQILGAVDAPEGRRHALAVLDDPAAALMLKVSALGTLGNHGLADDREVAGRYANSPDYRLRTAARQAVAKLDDALKP